MTCLNLQPHATVLPVVKGLITIYCSIIGHHYVGSTEETCLHNILVILEARFFVAGNNVWITNKQLYVRSHIIYMS